MPAPDTLSSAEVHLSLPNHPSGPAAHTSTDRQPAVDCQPSSNAHAVIATSRDLNHSLQLEPPSIKAGLKLGSSPTAGPQDIGSDSTGKAGVKSRRVSFLQPAEAQSLQQAAATEAADEWTVIQSDGSDSDYTSKAGAKPGLIRVRSQLPQEDLPHQMQGQGLPQAASLGLPLSNSNTEATLLSVTSSQLVKRKLRSLKVPLTGMGRVRAAGRAGTPCFVAEGTQEQGSTHSYSTKSSLATSIHSTAAAEDKDSSLLRMYVQDQPPHDQEEEAACVLHQHLSMIQASAGSSRSAVMSQPPYWGLESATQHAHRDSTAGAKFEALPVAEGKESITAFHPSWRLRANSLAPQVAQPQDQPGLTQAGTMDAENPLDKFYRPAGGLSKPPQHQLSLAEQAGCLNFGSHVVSKTQLPDQGSMRQKSVVRERSTIDDVVLSSEEDSQVEDEPEADSGYSTKAASQSRWFSDGFEDEQADEQQDEAYLGQDQYEEGQYADYHSEEGHSDEVNELAQQPGLDESLDVLPAGLASAPEVYSPMSHGATRVRSMITNRPFMLEEPMSPVAQRLGATMRPGSHVTFTSQSLGDSVVMQTQEQPLYRDWSQPAQSFSAAAATEAAAVPVSEAAAVPVSEAAAVPVSEAAAVPVSEVVPALETGQETQALSATGRKPLSDPGTVKAPKTGAMSKLTGSLFRRSGKRTVETQTTEYREEETQTSDEPELAPEVDSQQLVPGAGHPELGQELSFGDALKAPSASPGTDTSHGHHLMSDLIESHGPLGAGLIDTKEVGVPSQAVTQHAAEAAAQQLTLADMPATNMTTFQVHGHINLGLRPRQLTFSASAQPQQQQQLWPQSSGDAQTISAESLSAHLDHVSSQALPGLQSIDGHERSVVPLLQVPGESSLRSTDAPSAVDATTMPNPTDSTGVNDIKPGQGFSDVAPSLSWPGPATAVAVPSNRPNLAMSPPISRQPSAVVRAPSRQPSAMVRAPSRQPSAVVPAPSRQPSAVPAAALLAEANQQHSDTSTAAPTADPSSRVSQEHHTRPPLQSVGDILTMWAPLPKPVAAGPVPSCSYDSTYIVLPALSLYVAVPSP